MPRKNRKEDDLDTQTTFADMNVEGFRWYEPSRKKRGEQKTVKRTVSRKEYWQMVRGAFAAFAPFFAVMLISVGVMIAIAYLWLS